jgi:hypothetical protein
MAQELACHGNHMLFKPFGPDFLLHQRMEASVLSPRASACYTPVQDFESKQLLANLLDSPEDFVDQIERFAGSLAYSMAFGMRIITGNEWQLKRSHECLDNFLQAGQAGVWIVDALPWLNHLPTPLAPWKKTAKRWFTMSDELHQTNYTDALKRPG